MLVQGQTRRFQCAPATSAVPRKLTFACRAISDVLAHKRKSNWDRAADCRTLLLHNKFQDQRNRGEQFCSVNDGGQFLKIIGEKKEIAMNVVQPSVAKRAQRQLASMPIYTEQNTGQSSIPTGTPLDRSSETRWPS